jgi:hypothetical protein
MNKQKVPTLNYFGFTGEWVEKKIAEFLSNLDQTIDYIQKELAMLNEYKKGLLQGMFV